MHRIFRSLRDWLASLLVQPPPPDPLDQLGLRELADLPPTHPQCEAC
jgi:hypothetical protein